MKRGKPPDISTDTVKIYAKQSNILMINILNKLGIERHL